MYIIPSAVTTMHLSSVDTAAHCPTAEHLLQENDDTRRGNQHAEK